MKREIWDVENRGGLSAASENRGVLYRQVFDSMEELKVPSDMADRIMAGLEAEKGNLPEATAGNLSSAIVEDLSAARKQAMSFTGRGKVIVAGFGKYAVNIAACFVLALGMLTLNSTAGQQLIGIGSGEGASITSEVPVKAETDRKALRSHGNEQESALDENHDVDSGEVSDYEGRPAPVSAQNETSSVSETAGQNPASPGTDTGTASTPSSTEKQTVRSSERGSGASGSAGNRSSGNPAVSAGTPSSGGNSSRNTGTVPAVTENPSQNQSESSSAIGNNHGASPVENDPTAPEDQPEANLSPDDSSNVEPIPQELEGKRPFVFDSTHPVKELDGIEELTETMGYRPALPENLPEGWKVSSVEVIWGTTAQVIYSDGQNTVLYRTSAGATSVSSDRGTYPVVRESGIYQLEGDVEDRICLITWFFDNCSCSMAFDGAVSEEEALDWADRVPRTDVNS